MLRRLLVVGFTAVAIAACGSGGPTASTVASPSDAASAPAGASTAPSTAPSAAASSVAPSGAAARTMTVACDLVGVRKQPTTKGAVEGRIHAGSIVRVVDTVPGAVYSAGTCGTGGTQWIKIDQVDGKSATSVYGVQYVYGAAGFFK